MREDIEAIWPISVIADDDVGSNSGAVCRPEEETGSGDG
jgi:hypothetical protein